MKRPRDDGGAMKESIFRYLQSVKDALRDERGKLEDFVQLMTIFKTDSISVENLVMRVGNLFKDHPQLVGGFNAFLPRWYRMVAAIDFMHRVKNCFSGDSSMFGSFRNTLGQFLMEGTPIAEVHQQVEEFLKGHPDLIEEFKLFVPDTPETETPHNVQYESFDMHQDDNPYGDKLHQGGKSAEYSKLYDISNSSFSDKSIFKGLYTQEVNFCDKVEEKLQAGIYQEFLELLHMYIRKKINRTGLKNRVYDILVGYPDLMESFNDLLMQCDIYKLGILVGLVDKETLRNELYIAGPIKVLETQTNRGHYSDKKQEERDSAKEKDKERKRLNNGSSSVLEDEISKMSEPVDLSCQHTTPGRSSHFLTKHYQTLPDNMTGPDDASVLPGVLVSVTPGEDNSFKHMLRNQYEENLFRCEDDRFELDMLLEFAKSTVGRVEGFLNKINKSSKPKSTDDGVEDFLKKINESSEPEEIQDGKHLKFFKLKIDRIIIW